MISPDQKPSLDAFGRLRRSPKGKPLADLSSMGRIGNWFAQSFVRMAITKDGVPYGAIWRCRCANCGSFAEIRAGILMAVFKGKRNAPRCQICKIRTSSSYGKDPIVIDPNTRMAGIDLAKAEGER